jgi:hypothetical protein
MRQVYEEIYKKDERQVGFMKAQVVGLLGLLVF